MYFWTMVVNANSVLGFGHGRTGQYFDSRVVRKRAHLP